MSIDPSGQFMDAAVRRHWEDTRHHGIFFSKAQSGRGSDPQPHRKHGDHPRQDIRCAVASVRTDAVLSTGSV